VKQLSTLVVLILVFAVMLTACGSGAAADSPSSVVKAWNEALLVTLDGARARSLSCSSYQPSVDAAIAMLKGAGIKTDLSGFKYEDQSSTADTAIVHVYGKMKMDMSGQLTEVDYDKNVEVMKENGKWVACPKPE
jgi:hypothetical protein